ncbi:cupin domain-containing protein [Streptomyces sp. G44]|nr:cupin domain-containing protein [Streptomyces sp. G44]
MLMAITIFSEAARFGPIFNRVHGNINGFTNYALGARRRRAVLTPRRRKGGGVIVPLTEYPGRLQVFKQILTPREPKLVAHNGYEWLYVLAGRLRLLIGDRELRLGPGEVAEFDTTEPHWFGPADATDVEVLHLFGPQGQQATPRT